LDLYCGIDWATAHHDVAVVDTDGRVVARGRVGNDAAGSAPITRASGKKTVVLHRHIKNRRLAAVGPIWALASLRASPGARRHFDARRAGGDWNRQAQRCGVFQRTSFGLGDPYADVVHAEPFLYSVRSRLSGYPSVTGGACVGQPLRGTFPIMGRQSAVETSFRERMKHERERRRWSQADLSKLLQGRGLEHIYPTTVAKIESGERAVRIDEATAIADLFEVSVDVLLGRNVDRRLDLNYALRAVQNTARQSAQQMAAIDATLSDSLADLDALEFKGRETLEKEVVSAQRALRKAQAAFSNVAEFSLPPRGQVALRKTLVMREIRRAVVGPDATVVVAKKGDDEA
jgi:transcriptional regulator with XRE-family HTH domain